MNEETPSPVLMSLARAHGVATEYWSFHGEHVQVPASTLRSVLAAMGVDAQSDDACEASLLAHAHAPWDRALPWCLAAYVGEEHRIPVYLPHGASASVRAVHHDTGAEVQLAQIEYWVEPREIRGVLRGEASFVMPADAEVGWYTLHATISGEESPDTCDLAWAPPRAPHLDAGPRSQRTGLMLQMYATRSATSWGIGNLADTVRLGSWAHHQHGCDFVLINPIHAAEVVAPIEPSPYLPVSRQFLNPLCVSVMGICEYADAPMSTQEAIAALAADAQRLNGADLIDRDTSWRLQLAALELLYAVPASAERAAEFADYQRRQGERLRRFTTWCVLAEKHGSDTSAWPDDCTPASTPSDWTPADEDRARFHAWVQWVTQEQVSIAHQHLVRTGMSIGLINDLAVGVNPVGCDTWSAPEMFADQVSVGAPPDMYNAQGQNWSQPPWIPAALERSRYLEFRHLVATLLEHSGGLRIDHILGLFRLWWIPAGANASQGTYVRYDVDMMVAILLIAAHERGSVIIGEDLGNVEAGVRELLQRRGILGCSVVWFEYDDQGHPLPAERYRRESMVTVTTHDLPPTVGYLQSSHVHTGHQLGVRTGTLESDVQATEHEVRRVLGTVYSTDIPEAQPEEHAVALHRFVGTTPALLAGVYVPDLVGDRRSVNVPGTYREYPNWCVPVSDADGALVTVDDIMGHPHAEAILRALSSTENNAR